MSRKLSHLFYEWYGMSRKLSHIFFEVNRRGKPLLNKYINKRKGKFKKSLDQQKKDKIKLNKKL